MKHIFVTLLFSVVTLISAGQAHLVKDIVTWPGDIQSSINGDVIFTAAGERAYFVLRKGNNTSWWVTDATAGGTMEFDRASTTGNGGPLNGSFIYQVMGDGQSKIKIYTPGTDERPVLKEFTTMEKIGIVRSGDSFLFTIVIGNDMELWKSDGTASGTVKITTFPAGSNGLAGSINDGDSYTYFFTSNVFGGGGRLWRTDGTAGGTIQLIASMDGLFLMAEGNTLYFGVQKFNPDSYEIWKSDGSVAGTAKFTTILEWIASPTVKELNSTMIFSTTDALWVSDGTAIGTTQIASLTVDAGTVFKGIYYGIGSTGDLIVSDGTPGGTSIVTSLGIGPARNRPAFAALKDSLVVSMKTPEAGEEVGVVTIAGAVLLKDINPGTANSSAKGFTSIGDKVIFTANDGVHGHELWVADGTIDGTTLLLEISPGTADGERDLSIGPGMSAYADKLLFTVEGANDPNAGFPLIHDLWETDGTEANTFEILEGYDVLYWVGDLNSDSYFVASKPASTTHELIKLTRTALPATTTSIFSHTTVSAGFFIEKPVVVNGKLIFTWSTTGGAFNYGQECWVTDGTQEGTHVLKDINPGTAQGVLLQTPIVHNGLNYFLANDGTHGSEVWVTDGTEAGTRLLLDINPGPAMSVFVSTRSFIYGNEFFALGDKVYFFADDGIHGKQLWSTDGTADGTTRVTDIFEPNVMFTSAMTLGNIGTFVTSDATNGWRLWKTDGTANGTSVLKSFYPSNNPAYATREFVAADGRLLFIANDGTHGAELWVTDGTEAGTTILELTPGPEGKTPFRLKSINGVVYFASFGEFWRTLGTMETTEKILDMEPLNYKGAANQIYFYPYTDEYGVELHLVPFTRYSQALTLENVTTRIEGDANFTLTASSTSGLPVDFTSTPSGNVNI
jgi:ELWxxDGT repeat protein